MPTLSHYFHLNRRYSRSINLERDIDQPDALAGYILTERATDALRRILAGMSQDTAPSAWTLTGVYGTGKSAFAHFFSALFAPKDSKVKQGAIAIATQTFGSDTPEHDILTQYTSSPGFFRAVATAQREPLRQTLARALHTGAKTFWQKKKTPKVAQKIMDWALTDPGASPTFSNRQILTAIQDIANAARTDVVLIIDELGKTLEFAAQTQGEEDLYLLQQLAELPRTSGFRIHVFGLLHQSFADYSQRLAATERNEWAKIQGRFEDISFNDSPAQMTRLIGQAINASDATPYRTSIQKQSDAWQAMLQSTVGLSDITAPLLASTYPLHPLTAIVLPMICARYAQSDRSLFTFLTSAEPYSFQRFLDETPAQPKTLPTLKLHQVYDYFVEAVGTGMGTRPNLQRWVEIQSLIADARRLDPDRLNVLKTIGILNLITSTGALRATRSLVTLAMVESPTDTKQQKHWQTIIDTLLTQGLITHRRTLDELRLWEGSDFDVEEAIATHIEKERSPLAQILSDNAPLKPLIAQRHSYRTGTLRYFERKYLDDLDALEKLTCSRPTYDGIIVYWVSPHFLHHVPEHTPDGKPLIVLQAHAIHLLSDQALEYAALQTIQTSATQLQSDGVARREVAHRLIHARRLLDDALDQAFSLNSGSNPCWVQGEPEPIADTTHFNGMLSTVCDRVYDQSPILWNELVNRRDLTSQGAKARRELIEAMLESADQERLGLQGYGPEVSIYYSVLAESGIHRQVDGEWGFYPPPNIDNKDTSTSKSNRKSKKAISDESHLESAWSAMTGFCRKAVQQPQDIGRLYQMLETPPYGMKQGAIPIVLAAFLLHHVDDISVYKDGTFIPVLGPEHFELLVKAPERFALKYIEVVGLRSQVFRALEGILRRKPIASNTGIRNATMLSVVKPLFQFVRKLPTYTLKTERLSPEAQAVIQTLLKAQEPDELLFITLPQACGLDPIRSDQDDDGTIAQQFKEKLVHVLQEIQTAYDRLLTDCQTLLHDAFHLNSQDDNLRETLRVRAKSLHKKVVDRMLNSFVNAALDDSKDNRAWLEALVMIVADKPAESWTEGDRARFELNLKDLVQKFRRIEVLRLEMDNSSNNGFDARRITVTKPDGEEINRMVWLNPDTEKTVDPWINDLLEKCDDPKLQDVLYARLTERLYGQLPDESEQWEEKRKSQRTHSKGRKRAINDNP